MLWFLHTLCVAAPPTEPPTVAAHEARGLEAAPPRSPLHGALWPLRIVLLVPRALLWAVYVPPREGLEFVDRTHAIARVERVLYWNDAQTFGWLPLLSFNSDFGPQVGGQLFHRDLLRHDEDLTIQATYAGRVVQAYDGHFDAARLGGSLAWLEARARYERNPKLIFAGLGTQTDATQTRYSQERGLGQIGGGVGLGPDQQVQVGIVATANRRTFGPSLAKRSPDPSIETVFDTATLVGFAEGVTSLGVDAIVRADLRDDHGITSSGPYIEAFGGRVITDLGDPFWRYGAQIDVGINLYGGTRLLGFSMFVDAVEGDDADIPFTELPRLGGRNRLRGYREDQFRDTHAVGGTVSYRYPVHNNVEAQLFIDAGKVANSYSAVFDTTGWRSAFGGGLLIGSDSSVAMRIDASYGDTFRLFISTDVGRAFAGRSTRL